MLLEFCFIVNDQLFHSNWSSLVNCVLSFEKNSLIYLFLGTESWVNSLLWLLWIVRWFNWIKLPRYFCCMWDKLVLWLKQFLCEELFSFNLKIFCCSYGWSYSVYEGRISFCSWIVPWNLWGFLSMLSIGFTSFFFISYFLLCTQFLVMFHLTQTSFAHSTTFL